MCELADDAGAAMKIMDNFKIVKCGRGQLSHPNIVKLH